jgi:hypothetical protein
MMNFLLNSGATNGTFWVVLAALVVSLWPRARAIRPGRLASRAFLVLLALGTAFNLTFALYKGYVLPRDHLQDLVSAQEFLAGRSLYPDDLSRRMGDALEREPPRWSLGTVWPGQAEREREARHEVTSLHWVQAHPPLMSVSVAPLVAGLGISGTYAVLGLLSLAAAVLTLALLAHGLQLRLSRPQAATLLLLALGWAPLLHLVRSGQSGLLLGALVVAGWLCLHRQRPFLAGMCVGVACCLKLYPGLLLIYFLVRHRRAFLGGVLAAGALTLLVGVASGWHTYGEFWATSRGVVSEYAGYPNNLSLLAVLTRAVDGYGSLSDLTRGLFAVLAMALLTGLAWLARPGVRGDEDGPRRLDLEYSIVLVLMVVLSPVSWDHYLVVLFLPLAVLARRALAEDAGRAALPCFLALLALLSVPDTAFTWLGEDLQRHVGLAACNLALLSLRTFALLGMCSWLASLAARERSVAVVPAPVPQPASLPAAG